jgi:hypothetical protein
MCAVEVNGTPATEVIFNSAVDVTVITIDAGQADKSVRFEPATTSFPSTGLGSLYLIDLDKDEKREYVFESNWTPFRYYDPNGNLLFETAVPHIEPYPYTQWKLVDVDEDGVSEILVKSSEGVIVINADGGVRTRIIDASLHGFFVRKGPDGSTVILTYEQLTSPPWGDANFQAWTLQGESLSESDAIALVEAPSFPEGAKLTGDCGYDFDEEKTTVDLRGLDQTLRVELLNSLVQMVGRSFYGISHLDILQERRIIRVFDASNVLVYEEIFSADPYASNFAVVPSSVEGQDMFLFADGDHIFAYRVR